MEENSSFKGNNLYHNRSTDPSFQNSLFTSYADECRARKKFLEIKIAQISHIIEIAKKEIEIEEQKNPQFPTTFNIFNPIPVFDKIHMFINCSKSYDFCSSLLLTPSCHEPIRPQFHPNQQKNQNITHFNHDMKKMLCNITKVSDPDATNEVNIKPKPTESRKSIHMKMELIEKSAKLQKQYPHMYLTGEERDELYDLKKKTVNESSADYSMHTIKRIVPLFWPQRPGDEDFLLSPNDSDELLSKIKNEIESQSYENTGFRIIPQNKKKKREYFQKFKFPLNNSSTESSSQETEPDDFII